jgi:hypothetical protein
LLPSRELLGGHEEAQLQRRVKGHPLGAAIGLRHLGVGRELDQVAGGADEAKLPVRPVLSRGAEGRRVGGLAQAELGVERHQHRALAGGGDRRRGEEQGEPWEGRAHEPSVARSRGDAPAA